MAEHRRRGMVFLCLASAAVGFAMMIQMGLNANFVAGELRITGLQQGMLEAARETCGITALAVLAVLAGLAEPMIAAGSLIVFAAGLGCYAFVPDYAWLVAASLLWSQGLHVWMPLPGSMALSLAEPGQAGRRLGQIGAAGAVGSALGLVTALLLSVVAVPIRPQYVLGGAVALLAALACLAIPRAIKTPGPRLALRRKCALFYVLSFLEGWRKQISIAFAGFLLVRNYQTPLKVMLVLWIIVQAIGWFSMPLVGRLIDRVGERKVLVFDFAGLTLFFCGYALVRNQYCLWALFVVDNAFFVFAMALTTYVRRIAPPTEYTQTLSMGVAMNHVAAVSMPILGGLLWKYCGYQWAFFAGATVAAVSILAALRIPPRTAPSAA